MPTPPSPGRLPLSAPPDLRLPRSRPARGRSRPASEVQLPFRGATAPRLRRRAARARPDATRRRARPRRRRRRRVFPPDLLALARWIADYYLAPIGRVLAAALPGGLEGFGGSRARRVRRDERSRAARAWRCPSASRSPPSSAPRCRRDRRARSPGARSPPFLLHGVTGSGKTEVYLRAAPGAPTPGGQSARARARDRARAPGRGARSARRFGDRVGVLHSYLAVGERRATGSCARRGALDVVVGARSAVFAPLPALGARRGRRGARAGLQAERAAPLPRARHRAACARSCSAPVACSARPRPSLESLANAARGKYRALALPEPRRRPRRCPSVELVDLRARAPRRRRAAARAPLRRRARASALARGEQAMLFLNRRGHTHHRQCRGLRLRRRAARTATSRSRCTRAARVWRCHYCDHDEPAGAALPAVRRRRCCATGLRHAARRARAGRALPERARAAPRHRRARGRAASRRASSARSAAARPTSCSARR